MTDFAALRQRMVDNQLRPSEVTDRDVLDAFQTVPRERFVPADQRPFAYADRDLVMDEAVPGRRMMEPVRLARLINALPLGPEAKVMVVGGGTGYSAAILSRLAASVVVVEGDAALANKARSGLADVGATNVTVVEAKLTDGCPSAGPYDAILVDGSVEVAPDSLVKQLATGGMLATIERDERVSRATLYERVGDSVTQWPRFDAWAAVLPGFERKREFVF